MVYSQLYLIDICGAVKAYYVFTHARIYIFEPWLSLIIGIALFYAEWYKCYDSNNLNLVTKVL
jgi:hypothetical protein